MNKGSTKPALPKTLKFMGEQWKIYQIPETTIPLSLLGRIDFQERRIDVAEQPPSEEASTLLHEIFHLLDNVYVLGMEEQDILRLERGLWRIFQENPEMLAYLLKAACEYKRS